MWWGGGETGATEIARENGEGEIGTSNRRKVRNRRTDIEEKWEKSRNERK
jgi:hypothetical protein